MAPMNILAVEVERFWRIISDYQARSKCKVPVFVVKEWIDFLGVEKETLSGMVRWQQAQFKQALAFFEWQHIQEGYKDRNGENGSRAPGTIARRITTIRKISERLHHRGLLEENIWLDINVKGLERKKKLRNPELTPEQVADVLESFDLEKPKHYRNYVATVLYISTGCRLSEIVKLKLRDIRKSGSQGYLVLKSPKSGFEQIQPVPDDAFKILSDWLGCPTNRNLKESDPIIGISPDGFRRVLHKHFTKVGVKASCHAFRVTVVNNLLKKGVPIQDIRNYMRHSSIATTMLYERETKPLENRAIGIANELLK